MTDPEVTYWRSVACYLADCHVATAWMVYDDSQSSKMEKARHQRIVAITKALLKKEPTVKRLDQDVDGVLARLDLFQKENPE